MVYEEQLRIETSLRYHMFKRQIYVRSKQLLVSICCNTKQYKKFLRMKDDIESVAKYNNKISIILPEFNTTFITS